MILKYFLPFCGLSFHFFDGIVCWKYYFFPCWIILKFVKNQFTINVLVYFLTLNYILLIYIFIFISKCHSAKQKHSRSYVTFLYSEFYLDHCFPSVLTYSHVLGSKSQRFWLKGFQTHQDNTLHKTAIVNTTIGVF